MKDDAQEETLFSSMTEFRPLTRSDFALLQKWFAEPHIERWWHESPELVRIEFKYGPRIDGKEPTYVFIIEQEGSPVGWIQWYKWSDYPEHARTLGADVASAGMDLALGEKESVGKGLGCSLINQFLQKIIFKNSDIMRKTRG